MLYITFKKTEDVIWSVDGYFNYNYEDEWLNDAFVREMIRDVDRSEVLDVGAVKSPAFGIISPERLSGGVKALILMLKEDNRIWATACGDNCAKWIVEIGRKRDLTICLEHFMEFPEKFEAVCLDTGEEIHTMDDFRRCALKCL